MAISNPFLRLCTSTSVLTLSRSNRLHRPSRCKLVYRIRSRTSIPDNCYPSSFSRAMIRVMFRFCSSFDLQFDGFDFADEAGCVVF